MEIDLKELLVFLFRNSETQKLEKMFFSWPIFFPDTKKSFQPFFHTPEKMWIGKNFRRGAFLPRNLQRKEFILSQDKNNTSPFLSQLYFDNPREHPFATAAEHDKRISLSLQPTFLFSQNKPSPLLEKGNLLYLSQSARLGLEIQRSEFVFSEDTGERRNFDLFTVNENGDNFFHWAVKQRKTLLCLKLLNFNLKRKTFEVDDLKEKVEKKEHCDETHPFFTTPFLSQIPDGQGRTPAFLALKTWNFPLAIYLFIVSSSVRKIEKLQNECKKWFRS
jgi:hypothetical protein